MCQSCDIHVMMNSVFLLKAHLEMLCYLGVCICHDLVCVCVCVCAEKDWEDIRKMPEHSSLVRDFSRMRHKYVHYRTLFGALNVPSGCSS